MLAYPAVPVIKKKHTFVTNSGDADDEKEYTATSVSYDFDKYVFNKIGKKSVIKKTVTPSTSDDEEDTITYTEEEIEGISQAEEKTYISQLFRLSATEYDGEAISPDSFDYSFILDGDNDFTVEDGGKKVEAIQNLRLLPSTTKYNLPSLTAKLSDTSIKAPVLIFGKYDADDTDKTEGYATGVMSAEHINNTLKLSLSYTIFSGDYSQRQAGSTSVITKEDKKMGSFFATLTYNIVKGTKDEETIWDNITDETTSVMSFTNLCLIPSTEFDSSENATNEGWTNLVKVSAFERAASYQGQSKSDLNGW